MDKITIVNDISYIITNPNDIIQKTLLENVQWNNEIVELIKEFIKKYNLKHFLNIGTHIGTVSLPISKNIEKVTSIEAFYPTFCHLVDNINLNKVTNITPINIAIGDKKETIHFLSKDERWKDNSGGMRVITEMDKKYNIRFSDRVDNSISCEMFPLDEVTEIDNFDIMLVDIEGMEARFLQGAEKKILKNKPIIIIEIWDNEIRKSEKLLISRENVIKHIIDLGYTLYKSIDDDFIFIPK
jgi:FkbM family methyltransferase